MKGGVKGTGSRNEWGRGRRGQGAGVKGARGKSEGRSEGDRKQE